MAGYPEPITYDPQQQCWRVTSYDLGVAALHHPLLTTRTPEADEIEQDPDDPMGLIFQQAMLHDGAPHLRIRTLLDTAMRRQIRQMQPLIHQVMPALFQQSAPGPYDVERLFAAPLPLISLAHLLGLHVLAAPTTAATTAPPTLQPLLPRLSLWQRHLDAFGNLLTGYPTIMALAGAERLHDAVRRVLTHKRRWPADDLATVCATTPEFRSEDERIGNFIMLFGAGSGTTTTLLLNGPVHLLQLPAEFAQLRATIQAQPTQKTRLLRHLEEELLRLVTPTQSVARWALGDLTLGGKTLSKDDKVILHLATMNRDTAHFADPDQLQPARHNARDHLAFGMGPHACPGRPLALLEMLAVLNQMVALPNLRLAPGQTLTYGYNTTQHRLEQALIEWDA